MGGISFHRTVQCLFLHESVLLLDTNIETKLHWILFFNPVIIVEFTPFYPAT